MRADPISSEAPSAPGRGPSTRSHSFGAPDMPASFNSTDAPLTGLAGRRRGRPTTDETPSLLERNAILRAWAVRLFAGWPAATAADAIRVTLIRYRATAWERERVADEVPPHRLGRAGEFAWRALKAHDAVPASRTIRRIIAS